MHKLVYSPEVGAGYMKECNDEFKNSQEFVDDLINHIKEGQIVAFANDLKWVEDALNLKSVNEIKSILENHATNS